MFARAPFFAATTALVVVFAACGSEGGLAQDDDPRSPASAPTTAPTTDPPPPPRPTSDGGPTGPTGTLRFVAVGDVGTGSDEQQRVANSIAAKCANAGCDFVQLLGDNIYESGVSSTTDPLWQTAFETPYAAINLPFYAVLGNHDYGANGVGSDFAKGQNEIDYTLVSTKWKLPSAYYHHVEGPVELFALDTNMVLYNQAEKQKTDVTSWLAASTSKWKIALGHHPYLSNGSHGNAGNYDGLGFLGSGAAGVLNGNKVKTFMDDVVCGKVDLYIAGHDHSKQWLSETCEGTELAVSGAGAKVTDLKDRNAYLFQTLNIGFLYVTVTDAKIHAEFIDENGLVEFTHEITK